MRKRQLMPMIDWFFGFLSSPPLRVTSVLAMLVALAVFLAPSDDWSPDSASGAAFVLAFALWLQAELRALAPRYPHDLRLMDRILATVTEGERQLLRTMEMAEDWRFEDFSGINALRSWEGPDYQFLDPALQRRWGPALKAAAEFRTELARRSMPKGDGWYSVKAEAAREVWEQDAVFLNEASNDLTHKFDQFVTFARLRLAH